MIVRGGLSGASPELAGLADTVLQPGFVGVEVPDWLRRRLSEGLGGVALYSRNLVDSAQVRALTAALRAENPDVVIATDEEAGDVTRLEALTGSSRPGNLALGAVDDPELTELVARGVGRDMAEAGITLNYAPVVDVNSDLDNPVVGTRAFGADPWLVARHARAWVTGLQSAGVAACAKHFPGHGATAVDSHNDLPTVSYSAEELAATALPPYRTAIEAGVRAVMTGHLLVPAYDPEFPATMSSRILVGLLREELGFDGLIVTDGVEMPSVAERYGVTGAAVRALAAGADAVCVGGERKGAGVVGFMRNAIMAAVIDGTLPEERLAEAASRVRRLAAWSAEQRQVAWATDQAALTPAGLTAARRAVRVRGEGLPLTSAPQVIEFVSETNIAIDRATPWGVATPLAALLPGTTAVRLGPEDEVPPVPGGRPLVIVVRDAHRHAWVSARLDALLSRRPDAVVVEMGLPGPGTP
ncbi:glycoside hydrolase family 3 N-terminal domain-containing protein, partial [Streptosporangium canum]|uniref:glycoside hydrolase family 3 protein n=1 Tax=Streptosporangium canum TaxID=324952 RepID=UPI0034250A91